ncbi:hypothetical protein [Pantoea ananatis]|uniref:hypothetical protein n=1 Tax=Pantoea ananas TaxID=553 RepID=UPI001B3051AB|nr:hypothetical protein [Pantoea ananatis]
MSEVTKEKAKYRVLRLSHIHNKLWPEGSEVEYDGEPGTALEPLNAAAEAAKKKAEKKGKAVEVIVPNGIDNPPPAGGNGNQQNPEGGNGGNGQGDEDLDKLREEYEGLFNEKPHFNFKAETLREKIAEKRRELGL